MNFFIDAPRKNCTISKRSKLLRNKIFETVGPSLAASDSFRPWSAKAVIPTRLLITSFVGSGILLRTSAVGLNGIAARLEKHSGGKQMH
jgi:hypothetical protein